MTGKDFDRLPLQLRPTELVAELKRREDDLISLLDSIVEMFEINPETVPAGACDKMKQRRDRLRNRYAERQTTRAAALEWFDNEEQENGHD